MRAVPFVASMMGLALLPGCYLFHGLGAAVDLPDAASRRDAGLGVGPTFDGGTVPPMRTDAGRRDAGAPDPSEPDPDMGPGSRPSDYPDADDWEDTPPPVGDAPCCVLGDPLEVTSRDEGMALQHDPPLIAFGPGSWGLLVVRYYDGDDPMAPPRPVVFEVDRYGGGVTARHVLDVAAGAVSGDVAPEAYDLEFAEGRWAVALAGEVLTSVRASYARLYDTRFVPDGDWVSTAGSRTPTAVARLTVGDDWLAAARDSGALVATSFGHRSAGASTAFMARDSGDLDAVGLRSRVAVLLSRPDFPNDLYVIGAGPEYPELAVLPSRLPGGQPAALTALRDVVVTASVHDLALSVEVFDPFALRPIGRPTTVATLPDVEASTTLHRRAIDISGLDKHGLAAVCYGVPGPERGRGDDAIWLQIVDERGAPWAAPVPIVESGFRGSIVNCSVGNDGAGFLVGWWDGSVLWVRRVDLAL